MNNTNVEEKRIVSWAEDYILLSNGEKMLPEPGTKWDVDIIKKIMEAGD